MHRQLSGSIVAVTLLLALDVAANPHYVVEQSATFSLEQRKATYNMTPPTKRKGCADAVAEMKAAGKKVIHSSWRESPYLKFGGVPAGDGVDITFENADKLCVQYEGYWLRSANGKELTSIAAFLHVEIKQTVEVAKLTVENANRCVQLVDEILAAGLPATLPIEISAFGKVVTKTLADVKPNVCDVERAKGEALLKQLEESEGPLRKVLKADKLDIALSRKETQFFGVGRKPLVTPAQMAASKLWFIHSWSEERSCRSNDKPVHTIRRYAFDAKQVLVTETSKEYCGAPPTSAYR